jgi:excisionase family DNA binding protein
MAGKALRGIVMRESKNLESAFNPKLFDNRIMRIEQVAEMLQFSKWHIYRLVSQNKIPFRKKGKTLFFIEREIFDWLNEGVA